MPVLEAAAATAATGRAPAMAPPLVPRKLIGCCCRGEGRGCDSVGDVEEVLSTLLLLIVLEMESCLPVWAGNAS